MQKSYEIAGVAGRASHRAKNTANTTFSCGMLQNAGFGTIPWGGGGVVANREPGSYMLSYVKYAYTIIYPRLPETNLFSPFIPLGSFFPPFSTSNMHFQSLGPNLVVF